MSAEFGLTEGYMNPQATVAVGVCYKTVHVIATGRPWPSEFVWGVQNCVRWENVRVLGGVYDCPSWQATQLARGCGAAPNAPF